MIISTEVLQFAVFLFICLLKVYFNIVYISQRKRVCCVFVGLFIFYTDIFVLVHCLKIYIYSIFYFNFK